MSGIKLIGYSSDNYSERIIYCGNQNSNRFGKPIKSKKQKREERQNKLFSKKPPLELDEWFVYLVDEEKWYYKFAQDLKVLQMHHEAKFLGIGRPNQLVHKPNFPTKYLTQDLKKHFVEPKVNNISDDSICCYCEVKLTTRHISDKTHKTREHVIPKSKGGKIIKMACFECNQEKGGMMLHSYIQILNYELPYKSGAGLIKLQTKIKNANRLAKEIENDKNNQ